MPSQQTNYQWELINQILDESGGSVFILDAKRFRENVCTLRKAFTDRYPIFGIGYSYKTNYLPRLCLEADKLGLYAEVVSGMEYEIAHHLGIPGERIIFNGPTKNQEELKRSFNQGALVNVDSLSEASLVRGIAVQTDQTIRVGLRCNLDLQWNGRESRFGLSESSGELSAAWNLLNDMPNIEIEGLHCHTSFSRSASSYGRRISRLIEIADQLFDKVPPKFLDVGGGLCGPMPEPLAAQFKERPPSIEEYAEAICSPMIARYGRNGPELIVEPGVGLVGDTLDYAYRIEHIKRVGTRNFAMTNGAGHQIKIVPNEINLPTYVCRKNDPPNQSPKDVFDIVGYTCLEHDVIYRGLCETIDRGDILITRSVGAYSMVTSPDFIRTSPMVVELDGEGSWRILRHRSSTKQLLESFNW